MLVLHLSVIVTAIRVPVTVLLTYIGQFKGEEIIALVAGDSIPLPKQLEKKDVISKTVTMTLILLAAGIDAFSMIDDLMSSPDAFIEDVHLANSVLAFVSIALFLTNGVGTASQAQQDSFNYMFMILTNIPLLVIRCYLIVLDEDLDDIEGSSSRRSAFFTALHSQGSAPDRAVFGRIYSKGLF